MADQASVISELYRRIDTLDPDKQAIVRELAGRMGIGGGAATSVPGMEKLGGAPPKAPPPPKPDELKPDDQQEQNFFTSPHGLIRTGLREAMHGVEQAAQPGWDAKAGGASKVLRGIGKAAIPAAIPLVAANPVTAIAGTAGGSLAGMAGKAMASKLGASQNVQDLTQDVTGLAGGVAAGGAIKSIPKLPTGALKNREVQEALTDFIPYYGSKINRLRRALNPEPPPPPTAPAPPLRSDPGFSKWQQRGETQASPAPRPSMKPPPLRGSSSEWQAKPEPKPSAPPPPLQGSSLKRQIAAEQAANPGAPPPVPQANLTPYPLPKGVSYTPPPIPNAPPPVESAPPTPPAPKPQVAPPSAPSVNVKNAPSEYSEVGAQRGLAGGEDAFAKDTNIAHYLVQKGATRDLWNAASLERKNAMIAEVNRETGSKYKPIGVGSRYGRGVDQLSDMIGKAIDNLNNAKVGDTVYVKGQPMRVKSIQPQGFEVEPIQ